MKKILFIGNSFAVDATRYLYGIARAAGETVKMATLFYPGCSLEQHCRHIQANEPAYIFVINGMDSGIHVSLEKAILSDKWDIVAIHQCSPESGERERYFPYVTELAAYVREKAPEAKLWMQVTWSFEEGHPRFGLTSHTCRAEMIPAIRAAYATAAEAVEPELVVPALDAMNKLYDAIGARAYRDGFHCNVGVSRYMLASLWFMLLYGRDISGNTFRDFDVEVSDEDIALAQRFAREAALENGFSLT